MSVAIAPRRIEIALGERRYPIWVGAGLLDQGVELRRAVTGRQVLVVSNDVVAPLYLEPLMSALDGLAVEVLVLPDGEAYKNIDAWRRVIEVLVRMKASRDVTLVALGGGVIGDLTGFAAATWMRGVPFIQLPTTLLAQVDASVGGKTAVNLEAGKNLVGAFHQPSAVIIDTLTLKTLDRRELRSGLAEVVKYGLIRDRAFFEELIDTAPRMLDLDPESLIDTIEHCCREKADVVAADERESGVRALLNLGHTFGHAIEAVAGYGEVLHGEAVAIGCCAAAGLSHDLGLCPGEDVVAIEALFASLQLPTRLPPGLSADTLMQAMQLDKKSVSGRLRLVLMRGIGEAFVSEDTPAAAVRDCLERLG